MWEELKIEDFERLAEDPYPSIKEWKKKKKIPIVGSTPADVPEELIYAFGFLPHTILGTYKPLKKAPSLLPDNACSLARSNLEVVLSYEGEVFDGFVLPQVCDTTQHLSDIWRISTQGKYFESFLAPRQLDRPSSRYWIKKEIERLIESLESWTKRPFEEERLKEAIKIHNETKRLLSEIYEIKRVNPSILKNRTFFSMIKLSMQVDKRELNESLRKIKETIDRRGEDGYKPIILTGITCEPLSVFDLFDELKLNVVCDNLVTGSRYLRSIVDENKDPIEALVERHMKRGFFSPIHRDIFENINELKDLYGKCRPVAIIYTHIEFCESEEYDLPDLKVALKKEGIPMHVIETEFQTTSLSRERTRLQAFFESLEVDL